jgi:lipopolysaccharide/colanic/teichoic acid biosynthesis glycosyltransferase
MDKITPTLDHVVSDTVKNAGVSNGAIVKELNTEKIVLVVGRFLQRMPSEPHLKFIMVDNVADAESVMAEMWQIYNKIPAAIIYRYNYGFETGFPQWEEYFNIHPGRKQVPFFLYMEKVTGNLLSIKQNHPFIDDMISKDTLDTLSAKIEFVGRFKRMQNNWVKAKKDAETQTYKQRWSYFLKRAFDITAAGTLLILASPVMLLIAIAIKLESKGNIFYASPRAGRNYKVFKFYKFRTMVADADKQLSKLKHLNQYDSKGDGPTFYKVSNDPRITRLGNFLRNTSLDELPQLYNVIKGDMSLVGNRPLPLYEATTLTTDEWAARFLAPAGITGLWQISKRGKKEMSVQERIDLDINYANRNSFRYDMWLMINTPKALIQKDNV